MNKVLEFRIPERTTQEPSGSSLIREQKLATVHELIKPELRFRVYEERIDIGDTYTMNFFSILMESWSVKIVNNEENVDIASVLFVENWKSSYWMDIADFIRYTEPQIWIVWKENINGYILSLFSSSGIRINMRKTKDVFTDSVMDDKDVDTFQIENIEALWEKGYYACCIEDVDMEWRDYTVDDFISSEDISLLYLLCHAYCGYFGKKWSINGEWVHMNLDRCEWIKIHTTYIPIDILKKVILAGIFRKHTLYANFSPEKSIQEFYNTKVYPLLSEEYLNGGFEE